MNNFESDQTGLLAEHRSDLELKTNNTLLPDTPVFKPSKYAPDLFGDLEAADTSRTAPVAEPKQAKFDFSSNRSPDEIQERDIQKFLAALGSIPKPGEGCHIALLRVANLGVKLGLDDQSIFDYTRPAIPPGSRIVPDAEIWQAIAKAREVPSSTPARQRTPKHVARVVRKLRSPERTQDVLTHIIEHGGPVDPVELSKRSPVPINDNEPHMITLLRHLYSPDSLIFIGRRTDPGVLGDSIRKVSGWDNFFQEQCVKTRTPAEAAYFAEEFPHIMPNPLSGLLGKTKAGKDTYRGDDCIQDFRFAVGEFDVLAEDKQLSFWRGLGLPVCVLIHSGGKSIHAWLRVDGVQNAKDWTRIIEQGIFPVLGELGVDAACKNESRLSRLPGMFRPEKNTQQRLLWLCPEGGVL